MSIGLVATKRALVGAGKIVAICWAVPAIVGLMVADAWAVNSGVLARVGSEVILVDDLLRAERNMRRFAAGNAREMLQPFIDRKMLTLEARAKGFDQHPDVVAIVQQVRDRRLVERLYEEVMGRSFHIGRGTPVAFPPERIAQKAGDAGEPYPSRQPQRSSCHAGATAARCRFCDTRRASSPSIAPQRSRVGTRVSGRRKKHSIAGLSPSFFACRSAKCPNHTATRRALTTLSGLMKSATSVLRVKRRCCAKRWKNSRKKIAGPNI